MELTSADVLHVAELAKLELTEQEAAEFAHQLSAILDYAAQIQEVDTSDVAPTPYVLPLVNVLREDLAQPSLPQEDAVKNAADSADGYFRVRAIFEG